MRQRLLLGASLAYLIVADLIWIARDSRPPFWDMASHQRGALEIYEAFAGNGIRAISSALFKPLPYPPFYHFIVAAFYALFGKTVDAAQWANLPAVVLLLMATYAIGRTLLKPVSAAAAAVLVSFYPLLLWLSRETIIDYWLTAMVAVGIWLLLRTDEFSNRTRSVEFGVACGLGMLTKWTFALFVAPAAVWFARKNPKNAAIAASVGALISVYWYANAIPSLQELFRENSAGARFEGDPVRVSFQAVVFYVRTLEGYQLFFPLFVAFIVGAILVARSFDRAWIPVVLWIGAGWLGLMLFENKDPRYSAPLLPAVALITSRIFEKKERLILLFIPLLLFQHYLVSFGIPGLPSVVVLARGLDGPLPWNWNLYTQRYFGLWGPPAREDWQISHVLATVSAPNGPQVRLGLAPDIPRFDSQAFQFYIELGKFPVTLHRLVDMDEASIANNDYVLISARDGGFEAGSFFKDDLKRINQYVISRPQSFHPVATFPLPDGDKIGLYRVGS